MNKKKILATVLAACTLASVTGVVGCGGGTSAGDDGKYIYNVPSSSKLEIKVKNFGGGPGNIWLEETAERFAELKLNEQYGDKTGVYIKYESTFKQNTSAMASDSTSIFFDERMSDPSVLAQSGLLLNLDEIVKDETRIGGKLEDKIFESAKGGIQGRDGSYYALPHYEYYAGVAYNRTTFEELNAYFAADDEENVYEHSCDYGDAYFIADATAKKSVGPDGKTGVIEGKDYSADDGLPRSLDEFIIFCDYIKEISEGEVAPITVSGFYPKYKEYFIVGLWSALAGAEQMRNYYNCTGEIEVVKRDERGNLMFTQENLFTGIDYIKKPVTETITMSEDGKQGWRGNDMVAKYYAIAMLEIFEKEGFYSKTESGTENHFETQMDLFMDGQFNTNKSAMLIEGSYWFNESDENGGFESYEYYVGKDRSEIDVQWMSLPTSVYAEDAVGKDACFLDCGQAYAMINARVENNPALKQACIDFIKFCYSEAELQNFTVKTGLARAINYELTDAHKQGMSTYVAELWNARDNVNGSNVVAWSGTTQMFTAAKTTLKLCLDTSVLMNGDSKKAWQLLAEKGSDAVFAEVCLKQSTWESNWETLFGNK